MPVNFASKEWVYGRTAIGVFDSGLGGLTAVREIRSILPFENIIYFGDTSRVPYGGRSREILLKYARQDVHFLRSFDIKALLVACGTVSSNVLPDLQRESDLPILGVVEPACRKALAVTAISGWADSPPPRRCAPARMSAPSPPWTAA